MDLALIIMAAPDMSFGPRSRWDESPSHQRQLPAGLHRLLADDGNWLSAENTRLQTEKRFADCSGPSLEQNLDVGKMRESLKAVDMKAVDMKAVELPVCLLKFCHWRLSWTTKSCKTL
jgi:hypothetical protein